MNPSILQKYILLIGTILLSLSTLTSCVEEEPESGITKAHTRLDAYPCFYPAQGVDNNIVAMAQELVDISVDDVIVSLIDASGNDHIGPDGTITYGENESSGNVIFTLQDGAGTEKTAVVPVVVPATGPFRVWEGDFTLSYVRDLERLAGYTAVTGKLDIYTVFVPTDLENLDGLESLTSVGSLSINLHGHLFRDLEGLSNIITVRKNLTISTDIRTNLEGLRNIKSVGGVLRLKGNERITDLNGLRNITYVGGLDVYSNWILPNLDGLENIVFLGGSIRISQNDELIDVNGLNGIASVPENLTLESNDHLASIEGLSSLTAINGDLTISLSFALADVDGLRNITTINGNLLIEFNVGLNNLDGLKLPQNGGNGSLVRIAGNSEIAYNENLCLDTVDSFLNQNGLTIEGKTTSLRNGESSFCR